jgi:acyl-CoA reductase-like NAD-dependent aldehyde dehydrogenase
VTTVPRVDQIPLFLDGDEVAGRSQVIERENPARIRETVGSVSGASLAQVDAAIGAAARAWGPWSRLDVHERARQLAGAWDVTPDEREQMARLLSSELGKVLDDTRGELSYGLANVRFAIEHCDELEPRGTKDDEGRFSLGYVPYGVVAAIIPWNAPLVLASVKVGPALLAGNTVVVKPSPFVPLAVTTYLSRVASRLPAGVLNVVNGDGDVGETLVRDPRVDKIAFTGSGGVAKSILHAAADNVTPSLLELGGNDAALVLEDVDLTDDVMSRIVFGSMLTAGQVCMAIKRLFVHRSRFDEFLIRYREVADQVLALGDPLAPGTTVGPLVSDRQRQHVSSLVDQARSTGAEVTCIGRAADPSFDLEGGYFLQPTMVSGLDRSNALVTAEQFGPSVPIMPFDDDEAGVRAVNDSEYGLCASVWTSDEQRAFDLGARLHVGTVFVNTHNRSGMSLRTPFGGVKQSGYGREFGVDGLLEFAQRRVISHLATTQRSGGPNAGRMYPA